MSPHERLRFGVREDVIFNPRLSAGAARLYLALDSMAGFKGQCWPNQVVLAKRLGTTDRALRRWLAELAALVSMVHRRGANMYLLSWAEQGRKPILQGRTLASDVSGDGRTLASGDVGHRCPTFSLLDNQEIESSSFVCEKCKDTGRLQDGDQFRMDAPLCDCAMAQQIGQRLRRPLSDIMAARKRA